MEPISSKEYVYNKQYFSRYPVLIFCKNLQDAVFFSGELALCYPFLSAGAQLQFRGFRPSNLELSVEVDDWSLPIVQEVELN